MKAKVLPVTNLSNIEDMIFAYLEKNNLSQYSDHAKVMEKLNKTVLSGRSLVLVDDINDPTMFYWGVIDDNPLLVTEMVELITVAGWAEEMKDYEEMIKSVERKAKMRKVTDFFLPNYYPFKLFLDGFEEFEVANRKVIS